MAKVQHFFTTFGAVESNRLQRLFERESTSGVATPILTAFRRLFSKTTMTKSRWIELLEWGILAGIAMFALGVYMTSAEQEAVTSDAPMIQLDE